MAHPYIEAYQRHREAAARAYDLFKSWAPRAGKAPGIATEIRLAVRIDNGASIEEAAAREYLYRWHLAINGINGLVEASVRGSPIADAFAPHLLGQ